MKHNSKNNKEVLRPEITRIRMLTAGIVFAAVFVVSFLVIIANIAPKRYELKAGDIAPETITATKEVTDKVTTDQKIKQARDSVATMYKNDEQAALATTQSIKEYFARLTEIYDKAQTYKSAQQQEDTKPRGDGDWVDNLTPFQIEDLISMSSIELSNEELGTLLRSERSVIAMLENNVLSLVQHSFDSGLKAEYIAEQKVAIAEELDEKLGQANRPELLTIATKPVYAYLAPNLIEDKEATEAARDKKELEVTPEVYRRGQNIVIKGNIVTEAQIAVLGELGLLSEGKTDISLYVGVALYLAVFLGLLAAYVLLFAKDVLKVSKDIILLGVILITTIVLAGLAVRIDSRAVTLPFAAILIAIIFTDRLAIACNLALAAVVGVMISADGGIFSSQMVYSTLTFAVGGTVGVLAVRRTMHRTTILLAGLAAGGANILVAAAIGLLTTSELPTALTSAIWGFGTAVFSAVLCVGTLPIWEWVFDIVTPLKLLELANPNQPLIKRLMIEAPGTYHHSIMVGNLAERAAEVVGANPLLARVGSYFHDIGKLRRPSYFVENQLGENPHDAMVPDLSMQIITSHPRDGIQLAQKYGLPKPIQDIIYQHHGTTPVMYFYCKAKEEAKNSDGKVDMDSFRYTWPKPRTKEAAIVMLSDTIEAAVRSMSNPSQDEIRQKVHKLVRERIEDGQLDEAPLTLAEISDIEEAFVGVFTGMYHERVEYPDYDLNSDRDEQ